MRTPEVLEWALDIGEVFLCTYDKRQVLRSYLKQLESSTPSAKGVPFWHHLCCPPHRPDATRDQIYGPRANRRKIDYNSFVQGRNLLTMNEAEVNLELHEELPCDATCVKITGSESKTLKSEELFRGRTVPKGGLKRAAKVVAPPLHQYISVLREDWRFLAMGIREESSINSVNFETSELFLIDSGLLLHA